MPSSSDAVATTARSSPARSRRSTSKRVSRERLPWCGMTTPSPSRSFSANATRSLMRRVPTKISVVECARYLLRDAVVDLAPHLLAGDRTQLVARHLDGQRHLAPMADVDDRCAVGLRNRATSAIGRTVAERPMRCGFLPPSRATRSSRRSSVSARCAPRLSAAMAWISSTTTVRTPAKSARDRSAVSKMYSDSGVVTSTCGGLRSICCRCACVVSPVRTAVRIALSGSPASPASATICPSGFSRFSRTSFVSALSGET